MESKLNNFNLSQFRDINDCSSKMTIKTSKQWVLPPRPRPGRKPTSSSNSTPSPCASHTNSANPVPSLQPIQPTLKKEAKKTYKKKTPGEKAAAKQAKALAAAARSQMETFNSNPIELALKTIKDENKSLKVELSKLVSDLKLLQQQRQLDASIHKKRNHLQMEREESLGSDDDLNYLNVQGHDSEDEISSTISTPSLVSSHSSINSHSLNLSNSTSSLSSIKEEQVLKMDDFLTTSYFDQSNSISGPNPILKTKSIVKDENVMLSPPSIPIETSETKEDFEFTFLKQEKVPNNTHYDSLFNSISINENDDVFMDGDWDWK